MLRSILVKIFLILSLTAWNSTSHAVLFRAPTAGSEDFQKYALKTNQQTYTQSILRNAAPAEAEVHPQVLEFSQRALKEKVSKQLMTDWNRLRQSIELNKADREMLTLLAENLQVRPELCRYLELEPEIIPLLNNPDSANNCQALAQPLPKTLPAQLEANDILLIDGKALAKHQIPTKLIPGNYQWRIISDRYEDRHFTGTPQEFAAQKFYQQSWISGDCKNYKMNVSDFSLLAQSNIYFGDLCIPPAIPPERTFADWAKEHKTLLWGAAALAGILAASQLRDKTLVITRP